MVCRKDAAGACNRFQDSQCELFGTILQRELMAGPSTVGSLGATAIAEMVPHPACNRDAVGRAI